MLYIIIIIGWVITFGCFVYLAPQAIKHRLFYEDQKKVTNKKFLGLRRRHQFDERSQKSVQNLDGAVPPKASEALPKESEALQKASEASVRYRRRRVALFEFLMLLLWEAFWISEIAERFSESSKPFQLPYFFLFVVLFGFPLAVHLYLRWIVEHSVHSP
jgi:hypothetical protein